MADFIYQEPFPVGEDKTKYRLLTKEYVKVVECDGRKILKVDPKGLELLSKEAYADVSFYLRAAHLQKLRNILEDPEATDNDKFVAYTMLLNQTVSAEGELPTCQDTGTAICIGHKGEDVWTGADDAECIARGVYETYKDRNLRYSQVVPFTMTDEKNSGTNLPAQIDIYGGKPGMEYEFLFITKGGGSANKTFLYQQTKALLNEESLTKFIQQHIFDLGTSACPPYHLAICIGGIRALAQFGNHAVALIGIQQVLGKLCRFPQADRQHAGCQRIQRAGVPCSVGVINTLHFLQHVVAGCALWFIQQEHAMHVTTATTRTTHQSSLLSSAGLTRRSSSCFTTLVTRLDIRIPSTSELS